MGNPVTKEIVYKYTYNACKNAGTLANLKDRQKTAWQDYNLWRLTHKEEAAEKGEGFCNGAAQNYALRAARRNWKLVETVNDKGSNMLDIIPSTEPEEEHEIQLPTEKAFIKGKKPSERFLSANIYKHLEKTGISNHAQLTIWNLAAMDVLQRPETSELERLIIRDMLLPMEGAVTVKCNSVSEFVRETGFNRYIVQKTKDKTMVYVYGIAKILGKSWGIDMRKMKI